MVTRGYGGFLHKWGGAPSVTPVKSRKANKGPALETKQVFLRLHSGGLQRTVGHVRGVNIDDVSSISGVHGGVALLGERN